MSEASDLHLNARASALVEGLLADAERAGVRATEIEGGGRWVDAGIEARGGFEAGLALARICLGGLGEVSLTPGVPGLELEIPTPGVQVFTDHPVAACLASQYAGWALSTKGEGGKFFGMGSGPMRAAAGREALFEKIGFRERADRVAGVVETRDRGNPELYRRIAEACGVEPGAVTLLAAPTASAAGTTQVVARSVETALHKLMELGFDLSRVERGFGVAPLPPAAARGRDLEGIGRTNDAVLYGARVELHVRGDDDSLAEIGPKTPSSASTDHGQPFLEIFRRYDNDFYKVDPHLFSPAVVIFRNLDTGRSMAFGRFEPGVLNRSFA